MTKKERFKEFIVRSPEDINKEYSDIVVKIGNLELETITITLIESKQELRKFEIIELKKQAFKRVQELQTEMTESQAEIKRKEDLAKESLNNAVPENMPMPSLTAEDSRKYSEFEV